MFGTYKMDAYVCSALSPTEPSPSQVLSDFLDRDVYLVMKGPRVRPCGPTEAFPDLKASAVFQDGYPFLVASEESLEEVGRVVSRFAQDDTPQGRIGGIDREKWRDGGVNIERYAVLVRTC